MFIQNADSKKKGENEPKIILLYYFSFHL